MPTQALRNYIAKPFKRRRNISVNRLIILLKNFFVMSTSTLGTPVTREEAKKFSSSNSEFAISCQTHDECPDDGQCVNSTCMCMLDCGNRIKQSIYTSYCYVDSDRGSMSFDYANVPESESCEDNAD